jgi:WD40 repeat protein
VSVFPDGVGLVVDAEQVKSIAWKTGDRRLVTCAVDGSIILWNVLKGTKVRCG